MQKCQSKSHSYISRGKMDVKRMPVNRLSVSLAMQKGRSAMSVGPLERQLSVAVVTHNSACLF